MGELRPVNASRFQVLDVDDRCDIKTFVQRNDLLFKPGRGFYEFTKAEKVSDKKEVVLIDKVIIIIIVVNSLSIIISEMKNNVMWLLF